MKWAKRPEIRSRSFERKIGADHLDDIVRRSDLFDGFRWDSSHEMLDFSLVWFGKRCQTYAVRGRFPNMRKLLPIFALICCFRAAETTQAREVIHKDDVVVVSLPGEDLPATERDKTISYWSALIRSSAIRNGHNPDVGEAFMNKDKEVKIGERVIHPKGTLLTLNAQEATERINGKPLLADGIADSIADLRQKAGLKGNIVSLNPSGFEQLALWITALAPLLLLGGIIGAYLEFKIPGASLPGIISAICFALFFLGHYLAGLAGWEVVGLFVLGIVLRSEERRG